MMLNLPEEKDVANAAKEAMEGIEKYRSNLVDVLPKVEYFALVNNEIGENIFLNLLKNFQEFSTNREVIFMNKILIIEDNISLRNELVKLLNNNGYDCCVSDGGDYKNLLLENNIDLLLLDINLPNANGFEICNSIKLKHDIPIIIITGRSADIDEITGLSLGADDYIKKPYHSGVLLARIKRLLEKQEIASIKKYHGISLYTRKNIVTYNESQAYLTNTESLILEYLLYRPSEIIPRVELIEHLWDNQNFIDDNTLSVNVSRLRKKLKNIGIKDFIITIPKQGYRI